MAARFIEELKLDSFLSFATGAPALELGPLNVLIGPNGAGKTNVIEALGLLAALPTDFAKAIRLGGGVEEWLRKDFKKAPLPAVVNVRLARSPLTNQPLRYWLEFDAVAGRVEILSERIEEAGGGPGLAKAASFYQLNKGRSLISSGAASNGGSRVQRSLDLATLATDQSILAQRKDPDLYPEITWLGQQFARIASFREWSFGPHSALRRPQPADDPADVLLPDARNLALVLSEIQHRDTSAFNAAMRRFLPRYERLTIRIVGGTVQLFLHESGLSHPISASRLSDGTLRFLAIVAALLTPTPPPLLCLEEPELGMHPDALALLAELLVDASSRMQLVVTTHSDALLSALTDQVGSILVCENNGNGSSIRNLDADRLAFWLERYKLGEIWRLGEIGGNL